MILEIIGPDILNAIKDFVEMLITHFGTKGTIAIFASLTLVSFLWRLYNDRRRDNYINKLVEEKQRIIESRERELRYYQAMFFREKFGWTELQVSRFIEQNEFPAGDVNSRRFIEDKSVDSVQDSPKAKSTRRSKNKA